MPPTTATFAPPSATATGSCRSKARYLGSATLSPFAIHQVLTLLIALSALFAAGGALLLWRGREAQQRLLLAWALTAAAVEFIGWAGNRFGFVNAPFYNVLCLVEFLVLLRLAAWWPVRRAPWSLAVHVGFVLLWSVEVFSIGLRPQFVIYSFLYSTLVLVPLYLYLLWHIVNEHRGPLHRHAPFWLCLTVLIYFGSVAPILGSVNYFSKVDPEVGYRLVTVVRVLAVVRFVLMGITCLRARPAKPLPA